MRQLWRDASQIMFERVCITNCEFSSPRNGGSKRPRASLDVSVLVEGEICPRTLQGRETGMISLEDIDRYLILFFHLIGIQVAW